MSSKVDSFTSSQLADGRLNKDAVLPEIGMRNRTKETSAVPSRELPRVLTTSSSTDERQKVRKGATGPGAHSMTLFPTKGLGPAPVEDSDPMSTTMPTSDVVDSTYSNKSHPGDYGLEGLVMVEMQENKKKGKVPHSSKKNGTPKAPAKTPKGKLISPDMTPLFSSSNKKSRTADTATKPSSGGSSSKTKEGEQSPVDFSILTRGRSQHLEPYEESSGLHPCSPSTVSCPVSFTGSNSKGQPHLPSLQTPPASPSVDGNQSQDQSQSQRLRVPSVRAVSTPEVEQPTESHRAGDTEFSFYQLSAAPLADGQDDLNSSEAGSLSTDGAAGTGTEGNKEADKKSGAVVPPRPPSTGKESHKGERRRAPNAPLLNFAANSDADKYYGYMDLYYSTPAAPPMTVSGVIEPPQEGKDMLSSKSGLGAFEGSGGDVAADGAAAGLLGPPVYQHPPLELRNMGATCYMNASLQCLLHTPNLVPALEQEMTRFAEKKRKRGEEADPAKDVKDAECLLREFPGLVPFTRLGYPCVGAATYDYLLKVKAAAATYNSEFEGSGQNDAHEFVRTLLYVMHDEINRGAGHTASYEQLKDVKDESEETAFVRWVRHIRSVDDSAVYDYFGGILRAKCECSGCGHVSLTFDPFLDLSVHLPSSNSGSNSLRARLTRRTSNVGCETLDQIIRESFIEDTVEHLTGDNQLKCENCKKLCDGVRHQRVKVWPKILAVHLKRFLECGRKNSAKVVYPHTLRVKNLQYKLYAVCCHSGTERFGHYTSYVCVHASSDKDLMMRHFASPNPTVAITPAARAKPTSTAKNTQTPVPTPPPHERQREDKGEAKETSSTETSNPGVASKESQEGRQAPKQDSEEFTDNSFPTSPSASSAATSLQPRASVAGSPLLRRDTWYLCNDSYITVVDAKEAVSAVEKAYMLFYYLV